LTQEVTGGGALAVPVVYLHREVRERDMRVAPETGEEGCDIVIRGTRENEGKTLKAFKTIWKSDSRGGR
jgi:hypothetical protein